MSKEWKTPSVEEVKVKEDSASAGCQGKRLGCYAGSSCGSIEIKDHENNGQPRPQEKEGK